MTPQDPIADDDPATGTGRRKRNTAIAGAGALTMLLVPAGAMADPGVAPGSLPSDQAPAAGDGASFLADPAQMLQPTLDVLNREFPAPADAAGQPPTPQAAAPVVARPDEAAAAQPAAPPPAAPVVVAQPDLPEPTSQGSSLFDPASMVKPVIDSLDAALSVAPEISATPAAAPVPEEPTAPPDGLASLLDPARILGPAIGAVEGAITQPTRDHAVQGGETWRDLARNALAPGASPADIQAKADRIRADNGGAATPADGQVVQIVPSNVEDPRVLDRPAEGTVVRNAYLGAPPVLREVQPGETLAAIAKSNLAPDASPDQLRAELARLKSLNSLRDGGNLISPGEVILVEPAGPDRPLETCILHPPPTGPPEPPAQPERVPDGGLAVADQAGTSSADRRIVGPGGKAYPVVMPDAIHVPDKYRDAKDPAGFYDANWALTPDAPSSAVQTSGGHDPGWVTEGKPVIGMTTINDPGAVDYVLGAIVPTDLGAFGEPAGEGPYRDLLDTLSGESAAPSPEPSSSGLPPDNDFLTSRDKYTPPPRVPMPDDGRQEVAGAGVGALRAVDEALEREVHIKDNARAVYHTTFERNVKDGRTRAIVRVYKITTPPSGGEPVIQSFYGQPQADGKWKLRLVKALPPPASGQELRAR